MASTSLKTPETPLHALAPRWWFAVAIAIYLASLPVTEPPTRADAPYYIMDVLAVRTGAAPAARLWEFGHLLWRPFAYALTPAFLKMAPASLGWSENLKVLWGLVWVDRFCGLAALLLMTDLLRRVTRRPVGMLVAILVMVWGDAFLGYSQAGGPYIPGFALLMFGLWYALTHTSGTLARALIAGLASAASAAVWFTFVLAIPAVACADLFFGRAERPITWRDWRGRPLLLLAASGVFLAAIYAAGAGLAGAGSPAKFMEWLRASTHGTHVRLTALRAVSGCPRLLLDLGMTGITIKRYVFRDPYNPVTLVTLIRQALWPIACFWIFILATAAAMTRSPQGRRLLGLGAIAALPILIFSLTLYELSSPERFLPALPVLLLSVALLWETKGKLASAARATAIAFVALLPVMNGPTMLAGSGAASGTVKARLEEFRRFAGPDDLLLPAILTDPLTYFQINAAFDPVNIPKPPLVAPIIMPANVMTPEWRRTFAANVLATWQRGADAWVTKAALADRPRASTTWVEGDDPRVHWRDLPEFLRRLEYDKDTPGDDGFRRIRHSAANEAALRAVIGR